MRKPKELWWDYIKIILKHYPDDLLPNQKEAVDKTIAHFKTVKKEKVDLIEMVYFQKKYTIPEAAEALDIEFKKAKNWNEEFIRYVAMNLGLIERPTR